VSFDFDGDLGKFSLADGATHEAADFRSARIRCRVDAIGWDLSSATWTMDRSRRDLAGRRRDRDLHLPQIQRGELRSERLVSAVPDL
jgi:hypothetical protein